MEAKEEGLHEGKTDKAQFSLISSSSFLPLSSPHGILTSQISGQDKSSKAFGPLSGFATPPHTPSEMVGRRMGARTLVRLVQDGEGKEEVLTEARFSPSTAWGCQL